MSYSIYICILVSAVVSFAVRVLPLTLIRKQITNPFIRSFLHYVPYVTLSVMTFPAMIGAVSMPAAGIAAFMVGAVLSWRGVKLFPVALSCCATVLLIELLAAAF